MDLHYSVIYVKKRNFCNFHNFGVLRIYFKLGKVMVLLKKCNQNRNLWHASSVVVRLQFRLRFFEEVQLGNN